MSPGSLHRLLLPAFGAGLGSQVGELLGGSPGFLIGALLGAGLGVWVWLTTPRPPDSPV